ncbi:hypothetical protein ABT160_22990 [Streptomyces sp. NPDC001941]|uniref:hypothetical protein n=1 Tax=Streptomyces sp. NPDC001941 TaxID=3154659 RepID=UPI00332ECE2E
MPRREPNRRLAALLTDAQWSAADLARAVNALGAAQGLDLHYERTAVAHWLTGSRPHGPVPELAAQALSRRTRRLITAEDTGLAPHGRIGVLPEPAPAAEGDPVRRLNALARDDTDPAHRAHLARTAYTLSPVTVPDWAARVPLPRAGSGHRIVDADVEGLQDMTRTFACLCDRRGGGHARTALTSYLADDATALAAAPASRTLHRQILVNCAQLTHILAAMTADAGHQGLAQQYFRAALGLSLRADDRTSHAVTLRAMSTQALRLGHTHHAGELARAAHESAGTTAPAATLSYLLAQRALTSAADREPRRALADLNAAEQQHSRATSAPGPFSTYPQAGLDYQRAQILHALGDQQEAVSALRQAARHRPPSQRRLYVLTQLRLSDVLLDTGHVEEACAYARLALDHYPHLHSVRADKALAHLINRLRAFPRQRHAALALEQAYQLKQDWS